MTLTDALDTLVRAGRIKSAWLPGMRAVHETEPTTRLQYAHEGVRAKSLGYTHDTNDPLTVQGLLLLAREAYSDPMLHVTPWTTHDGRDVMVVWARLDGDSGFDGVADGPTEKDAIIAALVAAARECHA